MTRLTDEVPLAVDRSDLIRRVRGVLDGAGFTEKGIYERFGVEEVGRLSLGALDGPRLLWRTREEDPLSTLLRLFLIEVPVDRGALERAIAPMDPADWAELGLITLDGTRARGAVAMRPSESLILAHDRSFPEGGKRPDFVLGVTGTTLSLSEVTIRLPSRRTLDLGSGSGFLALKAAAHSEQVVASDCNARAVSMARFNILLNGFSNIEAVEGDLFEPVGDAPFDLIVSNPPFVISPENQLRFRDSGLRGDEICERIIRAAPGHLAEGGYFQALCNWARFKGSDWRERLLGWLAESGCDAHIIQISTQSVDAYANHWLRQTEIADRDRFAEAFDRWIAYYEQLGIEAIDNGLITLRRRTGDTNWIRIEMDRRENRPNGAAIQARFAAEDMLHRIGDPRRLLEERLCCRPQLRLVQHLKPNDTGWLVDEARCILGAGLAFEGPMDQSVFHLLTLCRGHQPLSAILSQVAALTGQNLDERLPAWLKTVTSLIHQGFLVPAGESLPGQE